MFVLNLLVARNSQIFFLSTLFIYCCLTALSHTLSNIRFLDHKLYAISRSLGKHFFGQHEKGAKVLHGRGLPGDVGVGKMSDELPE